MSSPSPRLLDVASERMRLRHFSARTSEAYLSWMRRFVRFHRGKHPRTMSGREVTAFLSDLATARRVSSSTQNQALAVLLFLFGDVLGRPFGLLDKLVRARRPARRPTVMSREEVRRVLEAQLRTVQLLHWREVAAGRGYVALPDALAVKTPSAPRALRW